MPLTKQSGIASCKDPSSIPVENHWISPLFSGGTAARIIRTTLETRVWEPGVPLLILCADLVKSLNFFMPQFLDMEHGI